MADLRTDYLPDDRDVSLDYGTKKTLEEFCDRMISEVKAKLDNMGVEYEDVIPIEANKNGKVTQCIGIVEKEPVNIDVQTEEGSDSYHGKGMTRMPVENVYEAMCTLTFNDDTGWSEDSYFDEHAQQFADDYVKFITSMKNGKQDYKKILGNVMNNKQYVLEHVYPEPVMSDERKTDLEKMESVLMPSGYDKDMLVRFYISDPADSNIKIPVIKPVIENHKLDLNELYKAAKINLNNYVINNLKILDTMHVMARHMVGPDAPDFIVDAVALQMKDEMTAKGADFNARMIYVARLPGFHASSILLSETGILMLCKATKIKEEFIILPIDIDEELIFVPNDDGQFKMKRKEIVDAVNSAKENSPFHDAFCEKALRFNVLKNTITIV